MPVVKLRIAATWLKGERGIAAGIGVVIGFLIALLIFGEPWHLQPDWGDLPTWLLFALGLVGGVTGLYQFRAFVRSAAEETGRNIKRDELLDRQLAEAEVRALAERRRQAEGIEVNWYKLGPNRTMAVVDNQSSRPISRVSLKVMSSVDHQLLKRPAECGEMPFRDEDGTPTRFIGTPKPIGEFATLRPRSACGFSFPEIAIEPDQVYVAWFNDDAGFRWQLDEYLHLVPAADDDEYLH